MINKTGGKIKGLASSQIVLLAIALIVLAVAAYLIYTTVIPSQNTISQEQCRAELLKVCTFCKATHPTSWRAGYTPTDAPIECDLGEKCGKNYQVTPSDGKYIVSANLCSPVGV